MVKKTDETTTSSVSPFQDDERDIASAEAMREIISELGFESDLGIKVQIWKLETGEPEARVWEGPPEDYDLMRTAREFGSGDYRVKLRAPVNPDGTGQIVNKGSRVDRIKLTYAEEQVITARGNAQSQPQALAAPPVDIAGQVAATINPILQEIARALAARPDPFEMLLKAKELFAPPPVTAAPVAPVAERSGSDLLQAAMAKRIETMGVFELAEKMGLGSFGGSDGEEGDISVGSLTGLASQFLKTIQAKQSEKPQPVTIENPPQQTEPEDDMMALIMVERAAKKNADADEWAETLAQFAETSVEVGNGQSVTLDAVIVASNWFEVLTAKKPSLAAYKPWLSTVRDKYIALTADDRAAAQNLTPSKDKGKSRKG